MIDNQMSTEDFIKGLTQPHQNSGLSTYVDEMKDESPFIEAEYNNNYIPAPQVQSDSQYLNVPIPNTQPPVNYKSPSNEEPTRNNDDLLAEAYHTTKDMAAREQILKENYLKANQRAYHTEKESYLKDMQLAQYFLKNAIEDQDADLQASMHAQISDLQSKLTKHDIEQEVFLNQYQRILDDKPKIVDYTPTYEQEETAYQESPIRQTFRKENSWYDFENPSYNPNLVQKAQEIEQRMVNEYQLKNMNNYLESPYYFEDLKGRLFKEFGVDAPVPQQQMHQSNPQNSNDWQGYQMNNPNNSFLPPQVPRFENQQNPFPTMPIQQPQQQRMMPQYQNQQQMMTPQSYGPPVAPVMHGRTVPTMSDSQAMLSNDAFDMFNAALNPNIAPQLAKLDHSQKLDLFNAAIKNQGKVR